MDSLRWTLKMKLLVSMTAMSLASSAQADFAKTPAETAMCQARIYARRDASDMDNWRHMHHYCDCLRFINRAYTARNRYDRRHDLDLAVGGCQYVLDKTKPDFFMRAEVMTQMAVGQKMLGQQMQAADTLLKAIQFDPNYVPAYTGLSDFYREAGDKKKALELIIEGLKREPDSNPLKRRYTELGGKLPYPEPIVPAPAVPPAVELQEVSSPTPRSPAESTEGAPVEAAPAGAQETPQKIGSPKNPYCRFCPD